MDAIMAVVPVNKLVDENRIIGKRGDEEEERNSLVSLTHKQFAPS
jgi:hypothetical protein